MTSLPRALRLLVGGLLGLLVAAPATAHDFWIEPSSFWPRPGQTVAVRLRVGEQFRGDAVARPPAASMHRFVLVDAGTKAGTDAGRNADTRAGLTIPGRTGADPAGMFRLSAPGAYIIGFHGKPNAIELPPDKFNAYLREEGLESVLEARAPNTLEQVEALAAPIRVGKGTRTTTPSPELMAILRVAYEEANGHRDDR